MYSALIIGRHVSSNKTFPWLSGCNQTGTTCLVYNLPRIRETDLDKRTSLLQDIKDTPLRVALLHPADRIIASKLGCFINR